MEHAMHISDATLLAADRCFSVTAKTCGFIEIRVLCQRVEING